MGFGSEVGILIDWLKSERFCSVFAGEGFSFEGEWELPVGIEGAFHTHYQFGFSGFCISGVGLLLFCPAFERRGSGVSFSP